MANQELQAKLNRMRAVVDEGGLHFESAPTAQVSSPPKNWVTSPPRSAVRAVAAPRPSDGGADFLTALSRRRATVDDAGETYQNQPEANKADCAHAAVALSRRSTEPQQPSRRAQGADFGEALERQRARVDEGALVHESCPVASGALSAAAPPSAAAPSDDVVAADDAEKEIAPILTAGCAAENAEEEVVADVAAEEADVDDPAAGTCSAAALVAPDDQPQILDVERPPLTALPTPSRAGTSEGVDADVAAASAAAAAAEAAADVEEASVEETAQVVGAIEILANRASVEETAQVVGAIEILANRVNWTVNDMEGMSPNCVMESPPFQATSSETRAVMRLRSTGNKGCELSVSIDSDRPAGLKAQLFVAKGWARQHLRDWPQSEDSMAEQFDVSLIGRSSVLCGMVYEESGATRNR